MGAEQDMQATPPPHSLEAEQAVLGALMLDNSCIDRVSDLLAAADFYLPEHRRAYESVNGMLKKGRPADVLTVFEDSGEPMQYLNAMVQSVVSSVHVRRYAQIVRERSLARQLIGIGREIEAAGHQPEGEVPEKIDAAMARLTKLGNGSAAQESVLLDAALVSFIDRLQAEADGNTKVIQTGLRGLDKLLAGGLREGELMVIGARPKMGKTALVLALARNMAHRNGVLLLSQEMPVHELVARSTAAMGSLNLADLRQAESLTTDGWARVVEAIDRMKGMRMVLDEQRALTLGDVRRKLMAAKRRQAVDVVVVDFLQLMSGNGENRNRELDDIANGLKAMAGEFKVAVILLSQMSREADKRHGPPVLTDLRDSGAIEAAADVIALLYREFAHPLGQHTEDFRQHAQLEIIQRNGAPGSINLTFNGEFQQFSDWEGPAPFRPMTRRKGGE